MRLLVTMVVKLLTNFIIGSTILRIIVYVGRVAKRVVFFLIPLVVLKFVTPSVTRLHDGTSGVLLFTFNVTCLSSVKTSFFKTTMNCGIVPFLRVTSSTGALGTLPRGLLGVSVPPIVGIVATLMLTTLVKLTAT